VAGASNTAPGQPSLLDLTRETRVDVDCTDSLLSMDLLTKLPPFDPKSGNLNVVIDTPKGSRNKYTYDFDRRTYLLKTVMPKGVVWPFDFGSIPGTEGDDGDPLDALVLMDESAFCGCLVETRLIGVIEAKQTEKGKTERNDRLISIAAESHTHRGIKLLSHLDATLLEEIEHFFISYNAARGKKFKPLRRGGPDRAKRLVEKSRKKV
jgi:inorganic pyrophosphatase